MSWGRPRFSPSGRRAEMAFVALLSDARIDDALEAAREADPDAFEALHVELRVRGNDGGRLEEALGGRVGLYLAARSAEERYEAERCRAYAVLEARIDDAPHANVLRAALATLRALAVDGDLLLAIDRVTARVSGSEELLGLDPARGFDPGEHLVVVREAEERRPGAGRLVRSYGLAKLARPDVAARSEEMAETVHALAEELALGRVIAPGERIGSATVTPRTGDGLADAPAESAPLYELREPARLKLVR